MRKVIAVDFDGCLCDNKWPQIGPPNMNVINAALMEQAQGAALILWTCRTGKLLEAAVEFCKQYGLYFDAVNENLPERITEYGGDCRKISADEYWDDRAVLRDAGNPVILPAQVLKHRTPTTREKRLKRID